MISTSSGAGNRVAGVDTGSTERVLDCVSFARSQSWRARIALLCLMLLAGLAAGLLLDSKLTKPVALSVVVLPLAFFGGMLSTWSPCGYSSLSLLRPKGKYRAGSVLAWIPTLLTHALGYLAGALLLGGALGTAGYALQAGAWSAVAAGLLALLALGYGLHQFDFLRMPYPQRRAQVPHDARFRFRSWFIGLLYGFALGMNYATYVQTPILYIVTIAAILSGNPADAVILFACFNAGRFLPMLVNLLPVTDRQVQGFLARYQERAVIADGTLLITAGAAALAICLG